MGAIVVLVIAGVMLLIGLAIAFFSEEIKLIGAGVAAVGVVAAGLVFGLGGFYSQDPGEAVVLKSFTGTIVGQSTEEGMHTKAPWVKKYKYDIRNQQVILAHAKGDEGQGANGPQVTVQDKEGVSANIDITVRYSIAPDAVTDIYKRYGSQENFISKFIENDIRAAVRLVPGQYTTLDLLTTGRAEAETAVRTYIEERWEGSGVNVESVSLQEIRYDETVSQNFSEAQNARIRVERAEAELEENKVKAESNRALTESLTPEVLEQKRLEALVEASKSGATIIVPEDFSGIVNLPSSAPKQ